MTTTTFEAFEADARAAGFDEALVREWGPDVTIDTHTHPFDVEAVVTQGEMWLSCGGDTRHLKAGDTFKVARGTEHAEFIRALERSGDLDRRIEFLPADEALQERLRSGQGLTRPELAVVLSYAKILINQQLLTSDIPEDPWLAAELDRYFPRP